MNTTQSQIIATTCELLEQQGFHATGLNQIVNISGAPKGSLYYYFPGGKDEIAEAAIAWAGRTVAARIRTHLSGDADVAAALRRFVLLIADQVEASGFRSGGPLMTVAMETATTNERLNLACRQAYGLLLAAFEETLLACGWSGEQAQALATMINAAIEGGVILSRTQHSAAPLRIVADQLERLVRASQP
jgi:TetR/AcrR family transcriptional regulator, lmrAB and yxaGH operons repressor